MTEYLTQAVVLGLRPHKESDRVVDLYTRDFGRLESNVVGGRRILSKLSPHLDLFNVITVRLAEKNRIILTDALTDESFRKNRRNPEFYPSAFRIISLVRALTPKGVPDLRLWHLIVKGLASADGNIKVFLKVLGYDLQEAECDICAGRPATLFRAKDQSFFCRNCGLKTKSDELTYL